MCESKFKYLANFYANGHYIYESFYSCMLKQANCTFLSVLGMLHAIASESCNVKHKLY